VTDASDFTIAGVLSQKFEDGKLHPVSFISKILSQAELNYDIFGKEMLAIVFWLRKWRYFLQQAEYKNSLLGSPKSYLFQNSHFFKQNAGKMG
jgi:hypothetical protein